MSAHAEAGHDTHAGGKKGPNLEAIANSMATANQQIFAARHDLMHAYMQAVNDKDVVTQDKYGRPVQAAIDLNREKVGEKASSLYKAAIDSRYDFSDNLREDAGDMLYELLGGVKPTDFGKIVASVGSGFNDSVIDQMLESFAEKKGQEAQAVALKELYDYLPDEEGRHAVLKAMGAAELIGTPKEPKREKEMIGYVMKNLPGTPLYQGAVKKLYKLGGDKKEEHH